MTPEYAFWHAKHIDKCPREDTREVVCKSPNVAYWYARDVDKCSRDDTREAACKKSFFAYFYAQDVDKCIRIDTWLAVKGTGYEKEYRKFFNELTKEDIII